MTHNNYFHSPVTDSNDKTSLVHIKLLQMENATCNFVENTYIILTCMFIYANIHISAHFIHLFIYSCRYI